MAKRPVVRLFFLGVLIAVGLALFFWLAPASPVMVQPAAMESVP
ncbi:MAG: hypothetical protein ACYC2K_16465 [Gemmatimonadales bacterium]